MPDDFTRQCGEALQLNGLIIILFVVVVEHCSLCYTVVIVFVIVDDKNLFLFLLFLLQL